MNFWSFLLGILVGLVFGVWIGRGAKSIQKPFELTQKQKNLDKILAYLENNDEVTNDQVQAITGVSDSTATNYLDDLEKLGLIEQIGETGRSVEYRKRLK